MRKVIMSRLLRSKKLFLLIIFFLIVVLLIIRFLQPKDKFITIAAGGHHFLALKADGSIVAKGDNSFGQ